MSPRPRTDQRQPNLQEAIKDTAWKQIAESGAASLSLRAIARELDITAPAIYNYYPSRDDLVTALIVDAFTSLAEAQEASITGLAQNRRAVRLSALGLAYREWAVTYPQRYHLIFGTPIPNYTAPEEVTQPAAAQALIPLIQAIQDLASAGELRTERLVDMSPKLESMLGTWSKFAGGIRPRGAVPRPGHLEPRARAGDARNHASNPVVFRQPGGSVSPGDKKPAHPIFIKVARWSLFDAPYLNRFEKKEKISCLNCMLSLEPVRLENILRVNW